MTGLRLAISATVRSRRSEATRLAAAEEQLAAMEEIATSSQVFAKLAQDLQNAVSRFKL